MKGSMGYAQDKPERIIVGVAGLSGALAHAFIPKDARLYEKYRLAVDLVISRRYAGDPSNSLRGKPPVKTLQTFKS
jgi:hypothetical protein